MKCPKCVRPIDHEAESCYSCGYSAIEAMSKYGDNYVRMSRTHDAAHCLRKKDKEDLDAVLDQLELRFPQMLFCAYLGDLPESVSVRELGFWLLNHGQVKGAEYSRPNDNAILVILDVNTKQIGLSLGYFSEMLISDEDAYRVLMTARPSLVNLEYGPAMCTLFTSLSRTLSRKAKKLKGLSHEQVQRCFKKDGFNVLDIPNHYSPQFSDQSSEKRKALVSA